MIARTDRLFVMPSFWQGMARALDIGATFDSYNVSRTETEADVKAVSSDWGVAVGDFREAATRVVHDVRDVAKAA